MEWKLEVQADFVFKKLLSNKEAIYQEAMAMAEDIGEMKSPVRNDKEKVERNTQQIDKFRRQTADFRKRGQSAQSEAC